MAARYCSRCLISYPSEKVQCPVCEQGIPYDAFGDPDPSWKEFVEIALEVRELAAQHSELETVIFNRAGRLLRAGLPYDRAVKLAKERDNEHGGFLVDIARFEKLMKRNHWSAEQVAAVLG